jgi:hypothetical protein
MKSASAVFVRLEGLYTNMAGSQKAGKRPRLSKFLGLFYCPPRQEPSQQLFGLM